jgi:Thioredoxin-like
LGPNKTIEVIFLSADHDESGFNGYYSTMPWMAVPYDDDGREALMGHIRVSGIPRLAVLDGKTGKVIEDNAVGKTFDVSRWRNLAAAAAATSSSSS